MSKWSAVAMRRYKRLWARKYRVNYSRRDRVKILGVVVHLEKLRSVINAPTTKAAK